MAIRWTDEARSKARARRGGVNGEGTPFDATKDLDALRMALPIVQKAFGERGPLVDLRRRALAAFEKGAPKKLDVDEQAALGVMTGFRGEVVRNGKLLQALLRAWVSLGGGDFAGRVLARIWTMVGRDEESPYTLDYDSIAQRRGGEFFLADFPFDDPSYFPGTEDPWIFLHEALIPLDDASYARARDAAEVARAKAPIVVRWMTNLAFPATRAWLEADLPELEKLKRFRADLLGSIDDPETAARWAKLSGKFGGSMRAHDLVDLLGEGAVPALVALLGAQGTNDGKVEVAKAAEAIETEEMARAFVEWLLLKPLAKSSGSWLKAHPALARPAIEKAIAAKSKAADLAKPILAGMTSTNVDAHVGEKPKGGPRKEAPSAATSTSVDVPSILADPPWRRPKKKVAPTVVPLKPIEIAPSITWAAGEKEEALGFPARVASRKNPHWGKKMYATYARSAGWNVDLLAFLEDDALALEIWKTKPAKEWVGPHFQGAPAWLLAIHGLEALPGAIAAAGAFPETCFAFLRGVRSADAVKVAAHVFHRLKKGKEEALAYLVSHAADATTTLLPIALGKPTKDREMAEAVLRAVAEKKHKEVIESARPYGDAAVRGLEGVLGASMAVGEFPDAPPKLPSFVDPASLPEVSLRSGKPLGEDETRALLELLAIAPIERKDLLADVLAACDRASLAAFGWALFSSWLVAGAPSKDVWAFTALGHLGDDDTARKLTPMIRAWPGESLHARAVTGLDVLGAIGTDLALMHLNGVAQKVKFKALQDRAREKIDAIAKTRGLTADELADRLVPDVGLDERGEAKLDFGARAFRVTFDEALTPIVVDEAGKTLGAPPKPAKSDDAAKAKEALEAFATLKKDVKAIARSQVLRLERAMCTRRRWDADAFVNFVAHEPLVRHLARRLVFATYDAKGKIAATFRVAEDGTFADASDAAFSLDRAAEIGVVHRLELDERTIARWSERFGEYEIVAPFEQLGRSTFAFEKTELASSTSTRVEDVKASPGAVRGLVNNGAWRLGPPQDSGGVWWIEARLGGDVIATLGLTPGLGPYGDDGEQTLCALSLVPKGTTFAALDPIVASELLRDLEGLRG